MNLKLQNMGIMPVWLTMASCLLLSWSADGASGGGSIPVARQATVEVGAPEFESRRMAWFREARFGMFIHWGIYAVPAGVYQGKDIGGIGEWIMKNAHIPVSEYKAFAQQFTASKYDPESWARLAKRAGMRYVVITSKHHDGCALFDSAVSDWNVVRASAAKRDLIAPLEKAVRSEGLRFGLYYSQSQDWINPGGGVYGNAKKWDALQEGKYDEYLTKIAVPQVDELLSKFHPDMVWWDTPVDITPARAAYFAPVLSRYPMLVTNNRLGGNVKGDCETPEQHIPPRGFPGRDFEVCMTMNDTWGYKSKDNHWKSVRQILEHLSDISSKGGNFLLNVGPTPEGVIPQASVDRLEAVGKWMDINGEAIHGTQGSPFAKRLIWGRVTRKADAQGGGETLYLHVWNWPEDGKLRVPHVAQEGARAVLLADRTELSIAVQGENLEISLPVRAPDPIISVIALHVPKSVVDPSSTLEKPDARGVVHLSVLEADSIGNLSGNIPVSGRGAETYFGPWTDASWRLEYRFEAPKAQSWRVQADIAAKNPVTMNVTAGKSKTNAPVPSTGGENQWQTVDLGTVSLGAGEAVFALGADKNHWTAIGLRNVTLTPVP